MPKDNEDFENENFEAGNYSIEDGNMIPINVTSKKKDLFAGTSVVGNDLERYLSQVINLNNESEVHEPTCPICSSPLREEAEAMWTKDQKPAPIKDMFLNKAGVKISKGIIENHMRFHLDKSIKEIQKIEYINRLQRLRNNNMTTLSKIDSAESILMERLIGINSIPPSSGDLSAVEVEKIKCGETVRLTSALNGDLKLRATIMGEMRSSGEVITLPTKDFTRVFIETIAAAQTERERNIISELLNKLKQIGN